MTNPLRVVANLIMVCLCGTAIGCGALPSGPTPAVDSPLGNPMFPGTSLVEVGTPAHLCRVTGEPVFTWKVTGERLVYVGVFEDNVTVTDGRITNTSSNIWAWHSGLGTGREGNVLFQQGVDVRDGILQVGRAPTPLQEGRTYVWAVWAWDEEGVQVIKSSQEIFFGVESVRAGVCGQL